MSDMAVPKWSTGTARFRWQAGPTAAALSTNTPSPVSTARARRRKDWSMWRAKRGLRLPAVSAASAHMLGLSGRLTVDPLFDEAGIPHGYLPAWRLPAALWMGISRGAWFFGFSPNCENIGTLKQRAAKAAAVLHLQALDSQSVILVGHGCINAFIWRELRLLGWRPEGFYRNRHWAANSLGRS